MSISYRGKRETRSINNTVWAVIVEKAEVSLRGNKVSDFEKIFSVLSTLFSVRWDGVCVYICLLKHGDFVGGWDEHFVRGKVVQCGEHLQIRFHKDFQSRWNPSESSAEETRKTYFKTT